MNYEHAKGTPNPLIISSQKWDPYFVRSIEICLAFFNRKMIFEHLLCDNFFDNFLSRTHISFLFACTSFDVRLYLYVKYPDRVRPNNSLLMITTFNR